MATQQTLEEKVSLIENKVTHVEDILQKSGIGILANLNVTNLLASNMGSLMGLMGSITPLMNADNLKALTALLPVLQTLSQIPPDKVQAFVHALQQELATTVTPDKLKNPPQVSVVGMMRQLNTPEMKETLGMVLMLLQAVSHAAKRTF